MTELSIVIAARNDNYGGDFTERLQLAINVHLTYMARFNLDAELIIVEWNPPPERPPLVEALRWPDDLPAGRVRIIRVPSDVHATVPNPKNMPMFEYMAKNTGLRRARGQFVLVTNADVLFSAALYRQIAAGTLDEGAFYRADRYDFDGRPDPTWDADRVIAYAKANVNTVVWRPPRKLGTRGFHKIPSTRLRWARLTGLWPSTYRGWTRYAYKWLTGWLPYIAERTEWNTAPIYDPHETAHGLHVYAPGDFLLAPRIGWQQINGFPEFPDTFVHLDSYGTTQLFALGLEQRLFLPPCMIFHADHARSEQGNRPSLSRERVRDDLAALRAGEKSPAINDETWGLAGVHLPEVDPAFQGQVKVPRS